MPKTAIIQTRIDENTKTQVQSILAALDISMSQAISMFLRQIVIHRGIPFELKIPNALTARTLDKADAGKELHRASNVDELFRELDS
jgi:DNA-damage-inducible protein J